ncbi:EAL domain-containing protein [Demequina sp.]|uniref:putative bifunctional diguanylate cyclase/phosphodiesterase n=1 Tax=Demequina sp. TaxID=2050685 RepID=UPI0025C0CB87|nr:EAL domain-containing protein [Demequina sp.]
MVSLFAIWSSQLAARAAAAATEASRQSQAFDRAAAAVAAEEALAHKYRLNPSVSVRADFNAASADLVAAFQQAYGDAGPEQRTLIQRARSRHDRYLSSIEEMFAAVDRNDTMEVSRIAGQEVDPEFNAIVVLVQGEADREHVVAMARIQEVQNLHDTVRGLVPLVFIIGLLMVAGLAAITRGYRKLLDAERAGALYASMHDGLTSLPNRTLMGDRLDELLKAGARTGATTGLLLMDLDRFKEVNDTFGHHYGDVLLRQIGPRLQTRLRSSDTVARLGGDEFAILLPNVGSLAAATRVADALQEALESPFHVEGVELEVEASIGVVISGRHGSDASTLLQHADTAMYVAKGSDLGVVAYESDTDTHSPERLVLLGELRHAIENDELFLHYQPTLDMGSGEVTGVEALVRWEHPTRGAVYPDDFVPLAEYTGLIGPLTRFVLNSALSQARSWVDEGAPLQVAVNLSARSLLDEHLPRSVEELLEAHGVPAALLKLEITESAIMADPERASRLLRGLADLGVEISIDDFGVGYTSLGQLKNLPISELKIDKSFVMTMHEDTSDALIVHSVIDLGHNLGLTIVAEGVENAEVLEHLSAYGCDDAQGYHLCRPIPAGEIDQWLSDRRGGRAGEDWGLRKWRNLATELFAQW